MKDFSFQLVMAWAGGILLVAALLVQGLKPLAKRMAEAWNQFKKRGQRSKIDWKLIENGVFVKDCERESSRGVCTGLDCYSYQNCRLAIRKPAPGPQKER